MDNLSIHPRNWNGVPGFGPGTPQRRKVNTAKARNGRARKLDRKQKRLSQRRTDHSNTVRGAKNPRAFRTPGSMND